MKPVSEKPGNGSRHCNVAKDMTGAVSVLLVTTYPSADNHVQLLVAELHDHGRCARGSVGGITIDEDVDVGVDISVHPAHDVTLALLRLASYDCPRSRCDFPCSVPRVVVVHVNPGFRKGGPEVEDDLRDR